MRTGPAFTALEELQCRPSLSYSRVPQVVSRKKGQEQEGCYKKTEGEEDVDKEQGKQRSLYDNRGTKTIKRCVQKDKRLNNHALQESELWLPIAAVRRRPSQANNVNAMAL